MESRSALRIFFEGSYGKPKMEAFYAFVWNYSYSAIQKKEKWGLGNRLMALPYSCHWMELTNHLKIYKFATSGISATYIFDNTK